MAGHTVKRGDGPTLRWNLERDLTGVTSAKVLVSSGPATPLVLDRMGTVTDAEAGTVALTLSPDDFGPDLLEVDKVYCVEIETMPGPLTHPTEGYASLKVIPDLG